jgi:dTDP-4-amino-4,6-dideoxygalactose transaminase
MTIAFLDLARLHASIRDELDAAFSSTIESSSFVGGRTSRSFEEAFAAAHDATDAVGCGSGTDALSLALRALGVGPGDEVIVPSMTFIATAEAVVHVGATPVLADVDPVSLLLTEAAVDAVRTDRTRAVIPVHLYGHVVDFAAIDAWRSSGLVVVEDAAQAHLADWDGEFVGSHADAACFSFYPGKNLGALGDAGAVIANDRAVADEVRLIRDHGRVTKYRHDVIGWCSRLDGLQAALLEVKLRHLAEWTDARREVAAHYAKFISDHLVPWTDGAVHHLMVVRAHDRDALQEALGAAGVQTGVHYPLALSQQPSLDLWARPTPNAEAGAATVLSVPMDPFMTPLEVETVAATVSAVVDRR